ncbi:MAG: tRNA lysidine(34) synthetase TilS [Perlucidibaca sp.]
MPESALTPVQDPANADPRFDRTLLRHELLPLLARRWPEAAGQLARSAGQLAAQAGALDALADDWFTRAALPSGALALPPLAALDDATLQAVIARWLARRGAPPLPLRHWPRLRAELLAARADAQPRLEWPGWSLRRYREAVYLLTDADAQPLPAEDADWPDPRLPLAWAGRVWRAEELVAGLVEGDPRLALPWRLAPRRGGERWRPPGKAHSVSVKHWCQEMGVPPWERGRVVCVWVGEEVMQVICLASSAAHER